MKLDSLVRFVSGYGQDFNYYHRVVFSFLLFNFSLCSRYPFRIWVEISAAAYRYICIEQKCRRWYTLRIWVVVNGICFVLLWAFKIELFLSYTLVNRNFFNDLRATWKSCSYDINILHKVYNRQIEVHSLINWSRTSYNYLQIY